MIAKVYKIQGKKGLFDEQFNVDRLTELGNPLAKVSNIINFESFRNELESTQKKSNNIHHVGAKPFDVVMMFKIVLLQYYFGLSYKQIEYHIIDRLSFRKFLKIETGDSVPKSKTIWLFAKNIQKNGVFKSILNQISQSLNVNGIKLRKGNCSDLILYKINKT